MQRDTPPAQAVISLLIVAGAITIGNFISWIVGAAFFTMAMYIYYFSLDWEND